MRTTYDHQVVSNSYTYLLMFTFRYDIISKVVHDNGHTFDFAAIAEWESLVSVFAAASYTRIAFLIASWQKPCVGGAVPQPPLSQDNWALTSRTGLAPLNLLLIDFLLLTFSSAAYSCCVIRLKPRLSSVG